MLEICVSIATKQRLPRRLKADHLIVKNGSAQWVPLNFDNDNDVNALRIIVMYAYILSAGVLCVG